SPKASGKFLRHEKNEKADEAAEQNVKPKNRRPADAEDFPDESSQSNIQNACGCDILCRLAIVRLSQILFSLNSSQRVSFQTQKILDWLSFPDIRERKA